MMVCVCVNKIITKVLAVVIYEFEFVLLFVKQDIIKVYIVFEFVLFFVQYLPFGCEDGERNYFGSSERAVYHEFLTVLFEEYAFMQDEEAEFFGGCCQVPYVVFCYHLRKKYITMSMIRHMSAMMPVR